MKRPRMNSHIGTAAAAASLLLGMATPAAAQLVNASAAALGTGENYTATARGYSAIALNPAGLAMPDNPGFSLAILPTRILTGLGPIGAADLKEYEGEFLTDEVKSAWYQRIADAGGEQGSAGLDVTYLALQAGRFGVQASTTMRAAAILGPGAAELALYGNAGRTGDAGDFTLNGSQLDVLAVSTAGISYAHPLIREAGHALSFGITVKQSIGHVLLSGRDAGSEIEGDPLSISVSFPIIHSDTAGDADSFDSGRGLSVDLGASWASGPLTVGATFRNAVNTFEWDEEKLFYLPGTILADADTTETDLDELPFASAPMSVQERIADLGFAPQLSVGAAFRVHPMLRVSGDFRTRTGESLLSGPKSHIGAGAEFSPVHWLPLRVGGAVITGGHLLTAGAGLRLGPLRLAGTVAQTVNEFGDGTMAMVTLSSGSF